MARRKMPQPTDAELAILSVLWDRGRSTVREVNEALNKDKPTGYTTTLKLMQIMAEKGLLRRNDSQFRHVYRPAISEERTQKQVVRSLADRAFAGSAGKLVMRALSTKKVTPKELAEIRKMIDGME
jgi:BlaI family transcriptional regulator, penicillinase repressor